MNGLAHYRFSIHSAYDDRARVQPRGRKKSGAGRIDLLRAVSPDPLSVYINGQSYIDYSGSYTCTAYASNGDGNYTYRWERSSNGYSGYRVSNALTYSAYVSQGDPAFYVRVIVTSAGQTAQDQIYVTVAGNCPGAEICIQ